MVRKNDRKSFIGKITFIDFSDHHTSTVKLDCTLLVMAGIGVYVYGMFSIIASVFAYQDGLEGN